MPTMDLSTAINIFLRQSIRENGMPFKITRDNPSSIEARRQTETHTWPCSITRPGTRGKDAVRPPHYQNMNIRSLQLHLGTCDKVEPMTERRCGDECLDYSRETRWGVRGRLA